MNSPGCDFQDPMKKSQRVGTQKRNPADRRDRTREQAVKAVRMTSRIRDVSRMESAPVAKSRVRISSGKTRPSGSRTIVFEEYVQDISSSGTTLAFKVNSFPLQPGVSTLFAWLAEQAINYQEYRFKRVSFRFETEQATAIAGKVMYAFTPDASDSAPANKQEMLEYGEKAKSAVWQEFNFPITLREALGVKRFIRSGNLAANLDIKTYDYGTLFVATQGVVATSLTVGELYVCYEIELITPVVNSLMAAQARSVNIASGGVVSTTAQFGTTPTTVNGLNVTVDSTGNILTFNRVGNYIVSFTVAGTGLFTVFTIPAGTQAGLTATALVNGISNAAANVGTVANGLFAVIVTSRGATWALGSWAGIATTVTFTAIRVSTYSEV